MKKQCMVLFVENNSGVLAKVSTMFMQKDFNIDSLTVSSTNDRNVSRITIMVSGDVEAFNELTKQIGKLVEAKLVFSVEPEFSLIRELLLVKFSSKSNEVEGLKVIINDFGANIIDISQGCFVVELTESSEKIDEFLHAISSYHILEMCRSGAIALERGLVTYELN